MRNSYLILDEYMRFLDNTGGSKTPSCSLLDVGVGAAMDRAGFDLVNFTNPLAAGSGLVERTPKKVGF